MDTPGIFLRAREIWRMLYMSSTVRKPSVKRRRVDDVSSCAKRV